MTLSIDSTSSADGNVGSEQVQQQLERRLRLYARPRGKELLLPAQRPFQI